MNNDPTAAGEDCILASLERPSNYRLYYNCLKQDLQDLSDLQDWTSLLPETPVIELPNYLLKLHKVCATIYGFDTRKRNL